MAGPKTYVGVGGKARQVKNIYVGVNGKARKVKKAYVGVSGKARLVYSSDWWCPTGVAASNVLAAYRFKGAASESAATTDLTGHGYTLSKGGNGGSPSWSAANGFYITNTSIWWQRLTNDTLVTKAIRSFVIRYANFPSVISEYPLSDAAGSTGYAVLYLSGGRKDGEVWTGTSLVRTEYPFIVKDTGGNVLWAKGTKMALTGTMGMTIQSAIYLNGNAMSTQSAYAAYSTGKANYGYLIPMPQAANLSIYAAAFFDVNLTAAQHKEVHTAMMEF